MFKSNEGNFSISINHINLKAIEQQSNHCITKDTPIFCYVQENKQNFIAKLKDNQSTIPITLDTTIQKDEDNLMILQNPKNIFLSFIPFKDNQEANNTIAQKLQLTTQDLHKGYKDINFRIPLLYLKDCEMFREWREEIEGEDLSGIEVVGKNVNVKLERVSDYSLNIIKQMAKASNNPKVTITSTTRTRMEQAVEMYNGCVSEGIQEQYKLYGANGDKVIKVYENLHKTKTRQEVIQAMYKKIVALGAHNVSNHCKEDISKINTIDISVWRLKNPQDFKREIQKFEKLKKLKFIDETKRQCYHIEIVQP